MSQVHPTESPVVSIVTPVFNGREVIETAVSSVYNQDYPHIEHIVVDGGSTDGTVEFIGNLRHRIGTLISEKDRGLYDAINKGIKKARGQIIGILNADDFYANNHVISRVVDEMRSGVALTFADLAYVNAQKIDQVTRFYSGSKWAPQKLRWGWIPPHPTVFIRREIYETHGLFDISFRIAGDFEFLARLFSGKAPTFKYIPETMVKMREGGMSNVSLRARWKTNEEILRACRKNHIATSRMLLALRYPFKLAEYFRPHKKQVAS